MSNPLVDLQLYRQSFWYDNIRRLHLKNGFFEKMIDDDGLRGVTSNPSIFNKAIATSDDYDEQLESLVGQGLGVEASYEQLAVQDIRDACDLLQDVFQESRGADGYVSLEVSPHLAHDYDQTVKEAKRLFDAVDRANVMIKVPATDAGIAAVEELIAAGVNINVTLMFSMDDYERVAKAYLKGMLELIGRGGDPATVASVASFFVSRVDTAVDKELNANGSPEALASLGQAAVANSRLVYQRYKQVFEGPQFRALAAQGARVQRLLWASTSTKNPAYSDTLYVDQLIGPDTVNTMPPNTVDAFRDHGVVEPTLERELNRSREIIDGLAAQGVDLPAIATQLKVDGVASFARAHDDLLTVLHDRMERRRD